MLIHETEKAWLVQRDDAEANTRVWIPKSIGQLELDPGEKDFYTLTLPEWMAKDKGLI